MSDEEMAAEVVEEVIEGYSTAGSGWFGIGFLVGAAVSGGVAYFVLRRRMEAKYSQIADEEIESMREHYRAKAMAHETRVGKEDLADIVQRQGYSDGPHTVDPTATDGPPMAVQPPDTDITDEPPVPKTQNIFEEHGNTQPAFEWNYKEEYKKRSPDEPYVIHEDELHEVDATYAHHQLVYYDQDGVVAGDRDEIMDPEEVDDIIGESNLERFGHGNSDPNSVLIVNNRLGLVYEVVKNNGSYAQEVHGFTPETWQPRNRIRERLSQGHDEQDEG